ncbi:NAD(P)-binding domain-containing protein [Embleya sp. NPDC127516]|uniref:NAD(P)-binding domain-containing protein n=1 Tax=Embleya sp. NPDC127516 TaxID=3363990 RepID=UPI0037FFA798
MPGAPFPGDPDRYPTRDEVVEYLRAYAACPDADIRTDTRVTAVTHDGDALLVETEGGARLSTPRVIAATGGFGRPHLPALPGLDVFEGRVLHASHYRNPKDFDGMRVVVVGGGNSAVQRAVDLADVARVSLATRGPLKWARQRVLGRELHWWLGHTVLDIAPLATRRQDHGGHRRRPPSRGTRDREPQPAADVRPPDHELDRMGRRPRRTPRRRRPGHRLPPPWTTSTPPAPSTPTACRRTTRALPPPSRSRLRRPGMAAQPVLREPARLRPRRRPRPEPTPQDRAPTGPVSGQPAASTPASIASACGSIR